MSIQYGVNTARALWNYHSRNLTCTNYPMIQDIEVTNACNLNCTFCERAKIEERGVGFMTDKTFHKIVNEENKPLLRHTRLFMHGEPLLHPKIVDFVREAKQYAKTVGFTTNATLLTESLGKELLEAGLDNVCFSFEGVNKETYESLRVNAKFETTKINIENFINLRNRMGKQCNATMAIVNTKETKDCLADFIRFWNEKGLNKVVVLAMHDWGLHGKREDVCLWPWWGLAIYWDGVISPCCLKEDQEVKLGNIHDLVNESIFGLWNSDDYQKFRFEMLSGSACRTCGLSNSTFVDEYLHVHKPSRWVFPQALWQIALAKMT